LSIVQPTVKTGTQLFQQLGDTQKFQVFLKRKKLFGGPPLTFQKEVSFGANYFTLNLASCADFFMFAITNGPKITPFFAKIIFQ
jgi:hypothetical protein